MNSVYQYLDLMIYLSNEIDIELEKIRLKHELLSCYVLLTDIKKAQQKQDSESKK